jgi:FlaA1/EpsC-like NDP-sugar epimerase
MKDPSIQDYIQERIIVEKDSKFKLSIELINGYYLSFLSIGLLLIILRNDITPDLKQALFFILMILISGTLRFFMRAASKEDNMDENKQNPQTIVHGNYYSGSRVGDSVYNTSNQNVTDIKMDTPSNYFDVLKTIEVVPDSPDPNQPGIKDVLIQLQSYVESDSTLVVSEKEAIFELIKRMAIEVKLDPITDDLISVVESIQKIDRNADFKSRTVQALKAGSILTLDQQLPHLSTKIVLAAIALSLNNQDNRDEYKDIRPRESQALMDEIESRISEGSLF